MPVNFRSYTNRAQKGSQEQNALNQALLELVRCIWPCGGYRFRRHYTTDSSSDQTFYFYCCQDKSRFGKPSTMNQRHRGRMDRFTCNSSLQLRLSFVERTLMLKMRHSYYTPYRNILLSSQAIDFINSRVLTQTPSEIYQNLLTMKIHGVDRIAQHQIYYQWQQANKRNWRHDDNQFVSSTLLLGGISDKYRHKTFILSNLRALDIYINASISSLALTTREIAIDATFGTNNAGMSLFAILAELDGIGIPLAYLFLERINSS